MAKPVHSMIRVLDEARSLDFYARAFGLEVADHLKFDDFALIYLRHPSSPFEVELTAKTKARTAEILEDLTSRYRAVWYFAEPPARRVVETAASNLLSDRSGRVRRPLAARHRRWVSRTLPGPPYAYHLGCGWLASEPRRS